MGIFRMAQEQQASAKPSLIERVFGSRIAQAVGIFGVAFTLFQGLEPFLKFSRFMAYLVDHWRELTRGIWRWLASFVHLDISPVLLDILTLVVFIVLFTTRSLRHAASSRTAAWDSLPSFMLKRLATIERDMSGRHKPLRLLFGSFSALCTTMIVTSVFAVVVVMWFLTLYIYYPTYHALANAVALTIAYAGWVTVLGQRRYLDHYELYTACFKNSTLVILVLIGLLFVNYIAVHSRNIEAFIKKATEAPDFLTEAL
jgi:hypothetical protein